MIQKCVLVATRTYCSSAAWFWHRTKQDKVIFWWTEQLSMSWIFDSIKVTLIPTELVLEFLTKLFALIELCILLRRLAYPNRLEDLSSMFRRSKSELSYIFNTVLNDVVDRHIYRLSSFNQKWLTMPHIEEYVSAIVTLRQVLGFIDGTIRPICRPFQNQRLFLVDTRGYTGWNFSPLQPQVICCLSKVLAIDFHAI